MGSLFDIGCSSVMFFAMWIFERLYSIISTDKIYSNSKKIGWGTKDFNMMKEKNMPDISFLIWNIHGMQGYNQYKTPRFVVDKILKENKDIVMITEFIRTTNWNVISRRFAKKYWRYTYPFCSENANEILILIKKGFYGIDDRVLNSLIPQTLPNNKDNPNFLQVSIPFPEKKKLYIMGVRIRDDEHKKQFALLNDYLQTLKLNDEDYVICGGDFNEWNRYVQKNIMMLTVSTPNVNLGSNPFPNTSAKDSTISTWSAVLKNKNTKITGKALIDHVATKNFSKIYLEDYCWDFVNITNGYLNRTDKDYKSDLFHLPDHAILKGKVDY